MNKKYASPTNSGDLINQPILSVVVPMYNESNGIRVLFDRLIPIISSVTPKWEIVCVDDGSVDATLLLLKEYNESDPRIKYISFSRNFGKEAALTAGLDYVSGQAVIPLDADLQDPPEMIPEMVGLWSEGHKVVLATRRSRIGESKVKRLSAWLYYKLVDSVTSVEIPRNTGDFRLMDQQVIHAIRKLPEESRYMKGLFAWVGFRSVTLYFDRDSRAVGSAKQSFRKLWHLAKDGFFSFTTLPLRLTTYAGVFIATLAFSFGVWKLLRVVIYGVDVPGYASIMATVLFMGGIQLISIGIVGEYIGRTYQEAKKRPLYIIEEAHGLDANQGQERI